MMHSGRGMTLEAAASTNQSTIGGGSYDGKIAGLYDLEETLGSGHFAVVKRARHVFTGAKVAVKVVDKTKLDEVSKSHLFQEVRCMKLVQHPNVVRLYEVIDTQTKLYLVLELGDGGDLYDYIMKHESGLKEDIARKYFCQILRAISYCHQLHVVHRDLKPENVVFFEKLGMVKLTDFGFSNKFSPGQKLETFCGSLAYSAPEILLGDSYDAPAVDIWSLGVILYMLVCGQPPFDKANDSETLTMIMDCKYTVPSHVTPLCRNLIGTMLVRDPKKRASLEEIAADPWIKKNSDYDTTDHLPLVSRQELSEEDHAFIIQKMINGNISSKEDILQSLDKNKYNHITATYFLLAEIRLRKRREEQNQKKQTQWKLSNNVAINAVQRGPTIPENNTKTGDGNKFSVSLCSATPYVSADTKTDKRSRKCSIVREEDEDDSSHDIVDTNSERCVVVAQRAPLCDDYLHQSVSMQDRANTSTPVLVPMHARTKIVIPVDATLAKKLNQIDMHPVVQEKASVPTDTSIRPILMQDTLRGLKELEIGKVKNLSATKNPVLPHRRTKLNKIRTPSCSSSEASDDDTKSRSKKKLNKLVGDTPTRFRMHRRDSHDDSSDSQDPTFPSSGSHGQAANIITTKNSSVGEKKNGQTQVKEQNKSEDKSSHSHSQKNKKQPKDNTEKQAHCDQKCLSQRRQRIRESQSLDRITEAQEYELRNRNIAIDTHSEVRNSLCNLNNLTVAETKEEYEDESVSNILEYCKANNSVNIVEASLQLKRNKNNIYHLNSIEEINLILEDNNITKTVHVTSSKYFVNMKKIRRLGKYFPVVNFS